MKAQCGDCCSTKRDKFKLRRKHKMDVFRPMEPVMEEISTSKVDSSCDDDHDSIHSNTKVTQAGEEEAVKMSKEAELQSKQLFRPYKRNDNYRSTDDNESKVMVKDRNRIEEKVDNLMIALHIKRMAMTELFESIDAMRKPKRKQKREYRKESQKLRETIYIEKQKVIVTQLFQVIEDIKEKHHRNDIRYQTALSVLRRMLDKVKAEKMKKAQSIATQTGDIETGCGMWP